MPGLRRKDSVYSIAPTGLLREHELLRQDLHSAAGVPRGTLAVGAVPTTIPVAACFVAQLQARYPGITPILRSLSSPEIETGLESLTLDLGLGYTDRGRNVVAVPQYVEQYFLLRRAEGGKAKQLQVGKTVRWADAASLPLCLLTPEMHNRTIVDKAFREAGVSIKPAIETNSIVSVVLGVLDGQVSAVVPGALMALVRGYPGLEALPLRDPDVRTPIGFMHVASARASRTLDAALTLATDGAWLRRAASQGGLLSI